MNNRPLISIILPVWNGGAFLSKAIESVLKQTYDNWELILVDDCSTDETPKIIETFLGRDPRIRSFRNSQNLKLPGSLNVGFSIAKGQYFTWISDDNLLMPKFLELMRKNIEELNCDFVYSNYWVIDENDTRTKLAQVGDLSTLAAENCIGASFLYKSEVMKVIGGYDTTKFMYEDYDYWVRIRLQGFDMQKIEESNYEYRIHDKQLSQTKSLPKDYLRFRIELPEKFKQNGVMFDRVKTVRILVFFLARNRQVLFAFQSLKYLKIGDIARFLKVIILDLHRKVKFL